MDCFLVTFPPGALGLPAVRLKFCVLSLRLSGRTLPLLAIVFDNLSVWQKRRRRILTNLRLAERKLDTSENRCSWLLASSFTLTSARAIISSSSRFCSTTGILLSLDSYSSDWKDNRFLSLLPTSMSSAGRQAGLSPVT